MSAQIAAILFDKDGTLFDFQATWGAFTADLIRGLAEGDSIAERRVADAIDFDLEAARFRPESAVIAGTGDVMTGAIARALPNRDPSEVQRLVSEAGNAAVQIPATPLPPLMSDLLHAGYRLGVATNDSEDGARAHLHAASIADALDFVAGFDSGFGSKPGPGQLLAFAAHVGHPPAACLMVGDSTHDLHAAAAAGMPAVAVLTGVATSRELAPHADAVLESIAALPAWLEGRNRARQASQTATP
ncbi:MAG: HAD family hydrolase [Pseudomonadota bacterium]